MTDSLLLAAAASLIFLLAGLVKGAIGLGLPTVAMGLLALLLAPAQAAALLILPSLVTNLWQLAAGPALGALLRRLWPMLLGICLGTWAGGGLLTGESAGRSAGWLGLALAVYAGLGLAALRPPAPGRAEGWLAGPVGAATGLVTAATGVFVLPAVPFLQAIGLEKEELVQALGLSFTVSTLALWAGLARDGVFTLEVGAASLLALLPALAGMALGTRLRHRVAPETFRRCFLLGLLALGLHLALRNLG